MLTWSKDDSGLSLGFRYGLFAAIASVINLVTQHFITSLTSGSLTWSIGAGTVAGFAAKYLMDKHWIFYDDFEGRLSELRKMILYGLFSVFTTALFWVAEIGSWLVWHTDLAKYSGAAVGLLIGYWLKYWLDRTYTFGSQNA
jgi:putative flippase GtrA